MKPAAALLEVSAGARVLGAAGGGALLRVNRNDRLERKQGERDAAFAEL